LNCSNGYKAGYGSVARRGDQLYCIVSLNIYHVTPFRPAGMYTCTYTFTRGDFDFYTSAEYSTIRTPAFFPWQRTLLHVILAGQVSAGLALVAFCLGQAESARKCAVVAFAATVGLAAFLTLGCNVAFAMYSQMVQYRFYTVSVSGIYEKHWGYSYYLELIGALLYGISFVIAVCLAVHLFRRDAMAVNDASASNHHQKMQYVPRWQQQYRMDPDDEYFAMRDLPDIPRKR